MTITAIADPPRQRCPHPTAAECRAARRLAIDINFMLLMASTAERPPPCPTHTPRLLDGQP